MEARLKVFGFLPGAPYWDDGVRLYAAPDHQAAEVLAHKDGLRDFPMELEGVFAEGQPRRLYWEGDPR